DPGVADLPCLHLLEAEGIVEREHRGEMLRFLEATRGGGADPQGGGVGSAELRMRLFQITQLPEEPVVFRIRKGGVVEYVVLATGAGENLPELCRPAGYGGVGGDHASCSASVARTVRLRPASFAAYRARSALLISSSGAVRSPPPQAAIPADTVMRISLSPSRYTWFSTALRTRSAKREASSSSAPGRIAMNSSPPYRPIMSISRAFSCKIFAVSASTTSPVGWPCVSLRSLKRSRSNIATASGWPLRLLRSCSSRSSSWTCRWLNSPVRP